MEASGKRTGGGKTKLDSTGQQHAGFSKTLKGAGLDTKGEIMGPRAHSDETRDEASKGPKVCEDHGPYGCDGEIKVGRVLLRKRSVVALLERFL